MNVPPKLNTATASFVGAGPSERYIKPPAAEKLAFGQDILSKSAYAVELEEPPTTAGFCKAFPAVV